MPKGIKTQKTELYALTTDVTPVFVKIGAFLDFSGLGGTRAEIDATNLDSLAKEFFAGLEDSGTFGANINLDPTDVGQQEMFTLKDAGAITSFCLALSDGTALPTLVSTTPTPPTARSSFMFTASVQQFSVSGAADNIVKGAVQLRITGPVTKTWKA